MQPSKGDFDYDKTEGKFGEQFCFEYLKSKYPETSIFDVSDFRIFQLLDIDYILGKTTTSANFVHNYLYGGGGSAEDLYTMLKSDDIMTIEVKIDTRTCGLHPTGNVVFEAVSHRSPGTYNTRAHYVFYVCSKETGENTGMFDVNGVFIIDMWKLREWHRKNHSSHCKTFVYDEAIDFRFEVERLVSDGIAKQLPEYIWLGWNYTTKEIEQHTISK